MSLRAASWPISRILCRHTQPCDAGDHLSGTPIAGSLVQPTRTSDGASNSVGAYRLLSPCLALLLVGFAWPATSLPPPVVSYTAVSSSPKERTLPAICLSVALAVGSPRPAVSRHLALWSADFPQFRRTKTAIARPTCYPDRTVIRARRQPRAACLPATAGLL